MLKRTLIFVFILSALALLAMAPMSASSVSENNQKRQETVEPTVVEPTVVEPTVESTIDPGVTLAVETLTPTPGFVPDTGNNDPSANMLTYALLAIIGIAVVVGGIALISRRQV